MDSLAGRLGEPDLVICLDSGCGNYDQLWGTTLRGLINGILTVEVLTEGVHWRRAASYRRASASRASSCHGSRTSRPARSGRGTSTWRSPRPGRRGAGGGRGLGPEIAASRYPVVEGCARRTTAVSSILANTWGPALAVTGAAGLPDLADGGNVLRPFTSLKLSLRIPPETGRGAGDPHLAELLESDPPYGARVRFAAAEPSPGWDAPVSEPWLVDAAHVASRRHFGRSAMFTGIGGSIPFMAMLGETVPAPSSSSPARAARARTLTARTSSCMCPSPSG